MKLTCEKSDLVRGVSRVQNVVSSKSTLPILANILMETNEKKLRMVATDLEVGVECSVPCEIESAGTTTVPAKRFSEIARELPEGKVEIEMEEGNRIAIRAGSVLFRLVGMGRDEFPTVPEVQAEREVSVPVSQLKAMIQRTIFAVSADVTRYTLNGVFWWMKEKEMRLVATDGHRLCLAKHGLETKVDGESAAIVPTKALEEMLRMSEGETGEFRIAFTKSHVLVQAHGVTLLSRLIEGKFPNYEQVLPKDSDRTMRCETEKLLRAVRRASLLGADRAYPVRLDITKGTLTVSSQAPDVGEAREELEVQFEGKDTSLSVNARYLLDVLKSLGAKEVVLEAGGASSPVVLRGASEPDYVAVVMPMRV